VSDVITAMFEIAADDIEHDGRHGMSNMRVVVNRHAAHVNFDKVRFEGLEVFFLTGEGVV